MTRTYDPLRVVRGQSGFPADGDAVIYGGPEAVERALQDLAAATARLAEARAGQGRLVRRARAAGASWQQVADRLGVTRQAAHTRFAES